MDKAKQPRVVITGGTGFLGQGLARKLVQEGMIPILVARIRPNRLPTDFEFRAWNGRNAEGWADCLEGALAVVNLAGLSRSKMVL